MPGAWEIEPDSLLAILIPYTDNTIVTLEWAIKLKKLIIPMNHFITIQKNLPIHVAREYMVEEALDKGATHILFIDADVMLPPWGLQVLLTHDYPIVSALYYRKSDPPTPSCWKKVKGKLQLLKKEDVEDKVVEVDAIGLGACLIQAKVFEKIKKPWFDWTFKPGKGGYSEDLFFCRKVRKAGFSIIVDGRVKCHHYGLAMTKEGKWTFASY